MTQLELRLWRSGAWVAILISSAWSLVCLATVYSRGLGYVVLLVITWAILVGALETLGEVNDALRQVESERLRLTRQDES